MKDLGLLVIRLVVGGLLAGHGAQKLFGAFQGPGIQGTAGWLASMGLTPAERWARVAGLSEFGSGLLTALGFLSPLGPLAIFGPMAVATGKVHWDKPIWVSQGGAELPVVNMAAGLGLAMAGPGKFSIDRLLSIRLPVVLVGMAVGGVMAGVAVALAQQPAPPPESPQVNTAGEELQGGEGAAGQPGM